MYNNIIILGGFLMTKTKQLANNLIDFIHNSPTMFHATSMVKNNLEHNGFIHLRQEDKWDLDQGGKYYVTTNDSALIAFIVNTKNPEKDGFRMIGAHTDSPGFRIKPNSQIKTENYLSLNTEVYGGPILASWFDRPLSIAGRISYSGEHILEPRHTLIDLEEAVGVIPNLAIHMNRDINKGVNLNSQKDTLPIIETINEQINKDYIKEIICEHTGISMDKFIDADLYLYPTEKGSLIGMDKEFVLAPRLDNLAMVYSGIGALLGAKHSSCISMMICFDNEEVGSRTKQGADSPFLSSTIERIMIALGKDQEDYHRAIAKSFLISADMAHAYHPNYPEKQDPTNKVLLGNGPAIKVSANQSYTSDSDSAVVFADICKVANVPYQTFVNRSDQPGGSTIGPVSAAHLDVRSIDIGAPMLGMHSCFELISTVDIAHTTLAFKAFFQV